MKQYWALLRMNLAGVPGQLGLIATVVIGIACAVGVLVSMLAMGAGARRETMGNVRPDRATVRSVGALGLMQSSIPKDVATLVREMPGIRRNAAGKPIAMLNVLVFVQARDKVTGAKTGFALSGASGKLTDYLPELHLTAGRLFRPGLREIIASNLCVQKYADFAVGDKRTMRGGDWTVVGNFDLGQWQGICIVYADADVVLASFKLTNFNEVGVILETVASFDELRAALDANPRMHVEVKHEAQVVDDGMKQLNAILNFVSYFVGSILAVAATLGAANSLYAVIDGRRRELATLRALGFRAGPIVASVLTESILLALPGALLGTGLAWLLFNGLAASPFGFTFHMAVTVPVATLGICWSLAMGLLGGLLPAVKAACVPVTVGLRAV
jgi:putative ABC transport system permease protein